MASVIEKRVNRTLNDIRLIGNRVSDIETPEQADAVEAVLAEALAETMSRLRKTKAARKTFSF